MGLQTSWAARGLLGMGLLAAVMAVNLGCQRRPYNLVEVSGTVTLDGKPLEGGHVTFQPIASGGRSDPGPGSYGVCDSEGRYSLTTVLGDSGVVVGRHRVSIRTRANPEAPVSDVDTQRIVERVPPWYNQNTQLELDVSSGGNTSADWHLFTRPPTGMTR